jgi:hypothetical protein
VIVLTNLQNTITDLDQNIYEKRCTYLNCIPTRHVEMVQVKAEEEKEEDPCTTFVDVPK